MKKNKDGSGGPAPATISDPRFARVHTDPRFMRMPTNKTKVSIDKRFSHMFSDKNFSDPLGADKRGRAKKKKEKHMLQRYYKVGEDEDEAEGNAEVDGSSGEETVEKTKSKGKDGSKTSIKALQGKQGGEKAKSKIVTGPKFPGPVAPSKLGLEVSDDEDSGDESDEDSVVNPTLKGKVAGRKAVKSVDGKKLARPKPSRLVVEESDEEESDEEEDSADEINLNSDEEEDLEINTGRKSRTAKVSIAEQDSVSEEEEDDEDDVSASDAESSSSSSSSESEAEDEIDDPREEEKVPTASGAETRRIAMMNMDWDHIKAVDLLMLMRSFQPKCGNVECVTIYPSEFGIEQMKAEEAHGPNMIFDDDDDDEDEDKEVNMEKLRAYERNKLKYYYAVVECDTKETANHLYTQCDGMEFERTSNTLDLRFIPDDMKFVREPRDVAKEVPQEGYKAPEFETRALQHSTVKLTWDDDEPTRVKALRKKFNADELNEMDFRDYLASASSEELDEGESPSSPERGTASNDAYSGATSKKDKYRSLLLGDSTEEVEPHGQKKKKGDVDMEVTFHTGLSELSEKLLQKKEAKKRGDETVWEAYLRKKKEKKSQKKRSKNAKNSDDDYSSDEDIASPRVEQGAADDDNGFDDPFFAEADEFPDESKAAPKKSKAKQSADSDRLKKREEKEQQKKEKERTKAELELLLMDDEGIQGAARGFNLKSKKKGKGKSKKGGKDDDDQEDDKLASADLTDPRFAPLFNNHHYAIDPTNPQFRKSAAQLKILAEAQRRRMQKSEDGGVSKVENTGSGDLNPEIDDAAQGSKDRKRKAELSSLVRSLKRKAGKPGK
ncbi:pre-rRNA-processing protein esf1 [Physcomitrium patens]|uniref:Uncharacterized protein n=1 Tax=Physcomitrium patens TaxID=3218 RepID=A0A2K1J312_PHYPA|nr:ESF1 homolog [Physcomitrium patens]PNR35911.1 hypothetical protein PHYPA_021761 [Physcomitrium patens]|eukprot:XP_024401095.1 ESF1 homolog [Physcomitrella patens]